MASFQGASEIEFKKLWCCRKNALIEGRRAHSTLDAFDQTDVLYLKHFVKIPDGFALHRIRFGRLKKEVIRFVRTVAVDTS